MTTHWTALLLEILISLCHFGLQQGATPAHTANLSTQLSKRGGFAWADGSVHWRVESVSMSVGIVGSPGAVSGGWENKMGSNVSCSVNLRTVSEESIS